MPIIDPTREDHAYFIGLFQTDGHLEKGKGQKGKATIELAAADVDLLMRLPQLFDGVNSSVSTRTRTTNFSADYTSATWRICNLAFRRELELCGVPAGRKSKQVAPPVVPFHPRGYFRGLLDGDGSVGFTRSGMPFISFVTASSSLADFFCATAQTVSGVIRTPKRNTRDDVFSLMVANDSAARLAEWAYPPDCLALDRKRLAAASVAAWVRPPGMRARPLLGSRVWAAAEDAIALSSTVKEAARVLGRTESAVVIRRWRLRHADGTDA
ncbi:LAGLIDADG family homing endonuclease [Rhodococcus fascians]|jgi:hypothetical protein|uniref:LAGLIDADG family homing endonuclease n=1 Tax=Nocardiaceae TaxID=85025 RepID=UPI0024B68FBB|nr:LAGLIDADG family homing endonuclease [Rhodococcus fascians]MDJ0005231.1 LAGLIDADG family homing endonuclease [Rhodococcus fascians]